MGFGASKQCWVPVNEKLAEKISDVGTWNKEEDLTGWLTCNDAGKFACIGSCQSTGRLSLAFNGIGDKEAEALAKGLKANTCINTLSLANNNIHSRGCKAICEALMPIGKNGGPQVEELDMRSNFAGADGGNALGMLLAANRILVRVYFSFNGLGNYGLYNLVWKLKASNKDCIIDLRFNGFDKKKGCNPDGSGDIDDWIELEEQMNKIKIKINDYDGSPPRGILGWPE
mmetsp:Transcript_95774/g.139897  ORF Transcript_95774/g.139897 Transcript_95774/m.139897 type:complete len:229 (+) Transcript_95774:139-825(+)